MRNLDTFQLLAEVLDGVEVALCLFDEQDNTLLWNRTFLRFFPEHDGKVHLGEPYRDNLRRFYRGRLSPQDLPHIERFIEAGIARHRAQDRPYEFEHRGRIVQVSSLPVPGLGRVRVWHSQQRPPAEAGEPPLHTFLQGGTGGQVVAPAELLERVPDGLMICGANGLVHWVNQPFVDMYGLTHRASALGFSFEAIYRQAWAKENDTHPHDLELGLGMLRESMRWSGAPFELPLPNERWCRVIARANDDGTVFFAHVDISELKRQQRLLELAERQARDSELSLQRKSAMLEATLDTMEQGVTMIGVDGRVEFYNQRLLELLDLPEALMDRHPPAEEVVSFLQARGEYENVTDLARESMERNRRMSEHARYERRRPNGVLLEVLTVPVKDGGTLRTFTDVTTRRDNEDRIRFVANHDGLTGLLNRGMFMECLAAEMAHALRGPHGCAVLFLDLDGFKPINDLHGHAVGDQALVWVAQTLHQVARDSDYVGRLGGDEFAVLQRGVTGRDQALGLARRLREALTVTLPLDGLSLRMGVSIGVAFCPQDAHESGELLRHADLAMYTAKKGGGTDGVCLFSEV